MSYWEKNRISEGKWTRQLILGIPMGLVFATPILMILFSGRYWYVRAEAVAQSSVNPFVLMLAVLIITTFVAFFYKKHQWEMKEQLYRELKVRGSRQSSDAAKEQDSVSNDVQ